MKYLLWAALVLAILYLLSLRGRTGHPGLGALRGWNYAHRGLHSEGVPENSLAAFRAAVDRGYGAEFDLHLLKDGNIAVIHDSKLLRTTGKEGVVEDLTTEDLKNYPLEGTTETIPTFREVLDVFAGKAPIIIELKPVNNVSQLCQRACEMMEGYEGVWCMESFDPRCVHWLKKNRPDILRGQLAENSLHYNRTNLHWALKAVLSWNLENFLCRPDFIAYDFGTRNTLSNFLCRRLFGLQGVTWTLRTPEDHAQAVKEGWIPIFENYLP